MMKIANEFKKSKVDFYTSPDCTRTGAMTGCPTPVSYTHLTLPTILLV